MLENEEVTYSMLLAVVELAEMAMMTSNLMMMKLVANNEEKRNINVEYKSSLGNTCNFPVNM